MCLVRRSVALSVAVSVALLWLHVLLRMSFNSQEPGLVPLPPIEEISLPLTPLMAISRDANYTAMIDNDVIKSKSQSLPSLPCSVTYLPSCPMNPYVRFWRRFMHEEDCYASPLRERNLRLSRKYLLFMPELVIL